ncbi:MAG: ribosomal protein S18-alanine N-acetyltransferase [Chitinispirillaceae bacterium]|nr:ribosomal protein S18-alanine N-acetyltransferase [Chitinispirillaceae bacterium]
MHYQTPPVITPLTAADFNAVRSIEYSGQRHPWPEALIREELAVPHGCHFGAVAEEERGLCAFILCRLIAEELHLHNLCTLPEQRRRGLATALVGHALSHARSAGARRAFLEVRAPNTAAIRLYTAHDFAMVVTRRTYYSNGDDALVMSRLL